MKFSPRKALAVPLIATVVATVSMIACQPAPLELRGGWKLHYISVDGKDTYIGSGGANNLNVTTAASNKHGNSRFAALHDSTPTSVNHSSCVTWTGPSIGVVQPGVMLRASTDSGHLRGIMVTNNIMFHVRNRVNVHMVDTRWETPYKQVGAVELDGLGTIYEMTDLPWRFCAKVQGRNLTVKAWSVPDGEPSWNDPKATGRFLLPASSVIAGRPGIYVGHLRPGDTARFTDFETAPA